MIHEQRVVRSEAAGIDQGWRTLYRAGGLAAGLYVALVLVPVVLIYVAPLPPTQGAALLQYIAAHRVVYLIELGCFVGLAVPALIVFTALTVALWPLGKGLALIGGLLGVASEVIALALGSSPQSLHGGLVVLSNAFASADNEDRRAALVSAADALIAATNAVSWAGILTAGGILVLSLAMRKGTFGIILATFGIVTGVAGIVCETLRPMIGGAYLVYGMLLPMWFGLVGWRLHLLGATQPTSTVPSSAEPSGPPAR